MDDSDYRSAIDVDSPDAGFYSTLGLSMVEDSPTHVRMDMPLRPGLMQPFGILHGGATIALLESAASWGATLDADLSIEVPFGVRADIKHKKPGREGTVHGEATLDHIEDQGKRGRKLFWHVRATDDAGDVISEGTFVTKTVSKKRLAEKARAHKEA